MLLDPAATATVLIEGLDEENNSEHSHSPGMESERKLEHFSNDDGAIVRTFKGIERDERLEKRKANGPISVTEDGIE